MTPTATKAIGKMASLGAKITRVSAAVGALTAGLGTAAIATKSFSKALDFEAEMSTIKALTGASTAQMAQMEELALTMGSKTKYSALQAAAGIEELLKAGLTPATVQTGGLEAALNLATAGGIELANAAEIMSTALNAYKKDGISAAEASNILAGTANASATGVEDLRTSLAAVSAVAAGFGMTFKDTNAAMGLFANNGFKGSDAGTSLKTMLQNLQPGTKEQIALFDKLGITTKGAGNKFFTASGKIESLANVAETLRKSLGKMNEMQRQAALEAMFGTDAIRAGNILYEEGADGVKKFYDEMSNVTALQVATEKMNNGKGAIEQFKGALETLQIKAVKPLLPAIKTTFNALGDYVNNKTPQITAAMETATTKASKWINDTFKNNQAFRDMSFSAKIDFAFEEIDKAYQKWYATGGKTSIESTAEKITSFLGEKLGVLAGPLADAGIKLGSAIGEGVIQGLDGMLTKHPLLSGLVAGTAAPVPIQGKAIVAATIAAQGYSNQARDAFNNSGIPEFATDFTAKMTTVPGMKQLNNAWNKILGIPKAILGDDGLTKVNGGLGRFFGIKSPEPSGYAGGLSRVGYNRMPALLHRDEMVLDKASADDYRANRGGSGGNVTVTGNTFNIRNESDIDAIAKAIATQAWQQRGMTR
ncbi:phage tail tape measure protein [Paenibacillus qinlingensis]|uniref:phage tail tape measure protein n=1 Tax=Paenibacillus qinlingensis TaxID=1837343 RepID=UPI0015661CF5|nr:phage tail tape measure protein [Paenibacillus qinlingensis]NQX61815.1 phage tail tape measure protein [Paenibacillus qinlingensis]